MKYYFLFLFFSLLITLSAKAEFYIESTSTGIVKTDGYDLPNGSKFLHRCYIECARQFYSSPYLFYHEIKSIHGHDAFLIENETVSQILNTIFKSN